MQAERHVTYWVIKSVAMSNLCRVDGIDDLMHCLHGLHAWICPGQLRVGDLFDDIVDELVTEVGMDVSRKILHSRKHFRPFVHLRKSKSWKWVVIELDERL